jgi:hypothetical protein
VAKPKLTNAARPATFDVEAYNERGEMVPTAIAGEHPLTLYLDKREIVTLMTLGHAPEALAIGYLRNQRLATSIEDIAAVQVDWETDSVAITTHSKKPIPALDKKTVTSGCGQGTVFGDLMEEIDQIHLRKDVFLEDTTCSRSSRSAQARDHLQAIRSGARLRARHHRGRDPDVRRGRRAPQRGRCDRRLHVARRDRRLRQGLLYHRATHVRDGDQVRADAHPVPGLALGASRIWATRSPRK